MFREVTIENFKAFCVVWLIAGILFMIMLAVVANYAEPPHQQAINTTTQFANDTIKGGW